MGLFIKNMEMPESCYYCPFADGSWGCSPPHKKRCLITGKDMPVDERFVQQNQVKCPIIEVPPHGDLIDRDALTEVFSECHDDWVKHQVEIAPTIIEAEDENGCM